MNGDTVLLSVVICTHNRSTDTVECLAALLPQRPDGVEIIVVDSASSENHAQVIRHYARSFPVVRYLRMDVPGISLARNAGLNAAAGDWIWWIDDDAIPMVDWPTKVFDAIARADGNTGVIGGKVVPKFQVGSDLSKLTDRWRLLLSCIERREPGFLSEGANVACANLLMKRTAALEAGGFSEELGRTPNQLLSGEESLLIEQLEDRGFRCAYDPNVVVLHKVSAERLTKEWISDRAYWEGHVRYRVLRHLNRGLPLSLNPIKLWMSIRFFDLLAAFKPEDADLTIRSNLARGTLDAFKESGVTGLKRTIDGRT
jgi:GT2 family glycosyltransferase